jgi:hypothetical protein
MTQSTPLLEIERRIEQLSHDEQLWLIERLVQSPRKNAHEKEAWAQSLTAMSIDPQIQRELRQIETEFSL